MHLVRNVKAVKFHVTLVDPCITNYLSLYHSVFLGG